VIVSAEVYEKLSQLVQQLKSKGSYFKVNESKMANELIGRYLKTYFEKDRKKIEQRFYDKRLYLKTLVTNSLSEEELEISLHNFIKSSSRKRSEREKKN